MSRYTTGYYICSVGTHPTDLERDVINLIGPFNNDSDAADYAATHITTSERWSTMQGATIQHLVPLPSWEKGAFKK